MGAFFDSIHARTEDSGGVQKALEQVALQCDAKFLLGPALNGWTSILPAGFGPNESLSEEIARHLACDVFHLAVHDDDIFLYYFYRGGKLVDQYNSCPEYFDEPTDEEIEKSEGHPELFQDLLPDPSSLKKLKNLLAAEEFTFESERMSEFADLFNLSNALTRYNYVRGGERKGFVHIEFRPQSAQDYNKRGEAKLSKNDLEGALADFKKALELDPGLTAAGENCNRVELARNDIKIQFARTHNETATRDRKMGNLGRALTLTNRAIELYPDYAAAYNNRGLIKKAKGDAAEALIDFNKAIELNANLSAAYVNRAGIKRDNGDVDEALADYDKAIELKNNSPTAYNNRGDLKYKKGDLDGALADYNRAIELKPASAVYYTNRSVVRRRKGDLDGALTDCNRAIELEKGRPALAVAHNLRGVLKHIKGDLDGALADYEKAITLCPKEIFVANRNKALKLIEERKG